MQLQYGTYTHAENECELSIARQAVIERGVTVRIRETWTINGFVNITGVETLDTLSGRITERINAYANDGGDLKLLNAGLVTAHQLLSADCIGGTRVVQRPSFPKGDGTEYATMRTFTAVVEGEYLAPAGATALVEFQETLEFSGGGPRWVMIETRRGQPQRQDTSEATSYRVRQSGRAVGHAAWPTIPGPKFPQHEHREQRVTTAGSPEGMGGAFINWPVAWSYVFESASPLVGIPNIQ